MSKEHRLFHSVSMRAPDWPRRAHPLVAVAIAATAVAMLAACGTGSPHGELAENQQILKSCDPATPPVSLVEVDGTGSSASDAIATERMTIIESVVRQTAICSGQLRVSVFSSSSAATATLFDGPLHLDGATVNARLKRVPQIVSDVMNKIRTAYDPAVAGLDQGGSDITAQYRLAGEWIAQVGGKSRLHLYLLTDGFQNIGVDLGSKALSKAEATALANQVTMPKLPGASVTVAGLGHVAGSPPPSDMVEGLVAYYDALCQKTAAAKCVSVTDYSPEGR